MSILNSLLVSFNRLTERGFFILVKLHELIDDFNLNQQVQGRKEKYIELCYYRLNKWRKFILSEFEIEEVEAAKGKHIKQYNLHAQNLDVEKAITINNAIATLRVFFNYLIEEEFIDEFDNVMRRISSLKEARSVINTFNDAEVSRVLQDVKEETYSNVRDKLILIMLFNTGIRVPELCSIRNSDIGRKSILIHGKGFKERMIYISKTMRRYMRN